MSTDPNNVPKATRQQIVRRENGDGVTRVIAAALKGPDELAFALRFLAEHYTYKRSKVGGVKAETAREVSDAFAAAWDTYEDETLEPNGIDIIGVVTSVPTKSDPISTLGAGKATNPYDTLYKG